MTESPPRSAAFIAFANQKGGAGKTTLAVNIAAQAARARMSVLGVDTDPQGSMEEIAAACGNTAGFHFDANRDAETLRHLRRVAGLYDIVVADTAGNLDETLRIVAEACDLVIIPCVPERAFIRPTLATAQFIRKLGIDYRILINQDDPVRHGGPAEDLRAALTKAGEPLLDARIRRFAAWPQAQLQGRLIPDYSGRGVPRSAAPAREDLHAAYSEIMAVLLRKARA